MAAALEAALAAWDYRRRNRAFVQQARTTGRDKAGTGRIVVEGKLGRRGPESRSQISLLVLAGPSLIGSVPLAFVKISVSFQYGKMKRLEHVSTGFDVR